MKTVLIVEDEKMIRLGIRAMIQRSDVPIGEILECHNGEAALEVLKTTPVDVMFTDIRMPKMDGIELVKRIQEMDHKPLVAAISGFDDFNYAVEMMRGGVREYLLKPVDRNKLIEILHQFEEELNNREEEQEEDQKLSLQQLKYLILNEQITESEKELLGKKFREFPREMNSVLVFSKQDLIGEEEDLIHLHDIENKDLCITTKDKAENIADTLDGSVGISELKSGLSDLRDAYFEASHLQRAAFCRNRSYMKANKKPQSAPEKFHERALREVKEDYIQKRIHIIGTKQKENLTKEFHAWFYNASSGYLTEEEFFESLFKTFEFISDFYSNPILKTPALSAAFEKLKQPLDYRSLQEYEKAFLGFLLELQMIIAESREISVNDGKMREAILYVQKHYAEDLNMAVVSNHVSINYSLFSTLFKQYTGENFVNYLKEIRMQKAKELLIETDDKISDIARSVGFENEKHFMKVFKAWCGVSAGEYRRNGQFRQSEV